MKDDDLAAAKAEVAQAVDDALGLVEQVGDEDDQPALADAVGEDVQRLRHVRPAPERRSSSVTRMDRRWLGRALGGTIVTIASSNVVRPTASRCRFMRNASDAASSAPYSSFVTPRDPYPIDALTSSSRWQSTLVSSSNFLT